MGQILTNFGCACVRKKSITYENNDSCKQRHTPAKKVLCVVPINTIQNWLNEFDMWLPKDPSKKEEKESQDTEPSEDGRATKKESSKKQTSSKGKRKRGKALNDKESLNSEATATTEESLDGGNQATEYKLLNDNDNAAEGEDSVKEAASDRGEDVSREERLAKDEVCTEKEVNSTSEGGIIKPAADTKEVKEDATADGEQMSTDGEAREKGELSVEQVSSEIRLSATEEESPRENGSKVGESVRGAGSTDERVTPNLELAKESEPAMKDEPSISNQSGQDSEVLTEGQSSIGAQEKLKDEPKVHYRDFDVFLIGDGQKNTLSRAKVVGTWHQEGGVLLIGYEMFRMISMYTASLCNSVTNVKGKRRKLKAKKLPAVIDIEEEEREMQLILGMQRALCKPGPDLVICDEGHRIKNYQSNISQALHKIRTRKRLVLTGYPLQNNLMEYWCMVDFVRPLYLGSRHDFANMFERPIVNGQCLDSNAHDKRLMRYRAHVLHSLLQGFVQRRGYSVLKQALPPKEEHVIMVKLSRIQQALYRRFIELCTEGYGEQLNPIRIFAVCSKIWNHPDVLYKAMNGGKSGKGVNLFDTDEDFAPEDGTNKNKSKSQSRTGFGSSNVLDGLNPFGAEARVLLMMAADWADTPINGRVIAVVQSLEISIHLYCASHVSGQKNVHQLILPYKAKAVYDSHDYNDGLIETSGKMILLMEILNESIAHGDKLLVFSQSLMTLDLIEELLNKTPLTETSETTSTDQERKQPKRWKKDRDYFRIDGGTPATEREKLINRFNNKENKEIKLFLLSTRAGCLGINLVGANRVVVFDVSWNPCHDAQAVCRVYRYGQEKPCFIYRFVASNTMEKRMYYRQISKQGVSDRVIDELNPAENFYKDELHKLLASNWEEESDQDYNQEASHIADPVLKKLMLQNGTWIQTTPFKHESLLEDQKGMKLSKAEKKEAKRGYEEEKRYASGGRSNFAIGMPLAPRPYLSTDKPVMSVRPMVQTSSTQSDTSTTFSPILAPFPPETLHHFGGTTPPPETFILRLPNPTSNVTVINLSTPSSAGSITTLPSILPSVPGWTRNRSGSASSSWTQSSSDIRTSDSFTSTTSESATDVRQLPHLVPAFSTSASLSRPTDAGTDNTGSTRTESPTESQRALLAQIPMSTLTALYSFGDEGKLLLPDGRVIANPYMPTRGSTAGSHSRDKDGGSDNPILIDDEEDE